MHWYVSSVIYTLRYSSFCLVDLAEITSISNTYSADYHPTRKQLKKLIGAGPLRFRIALIQCLWDIWRLFRKLCCTVTHRYRRSDSCTYPIPCQRPSLARSGLLIYTWDNLTGSLPISHRFRYFPSLQSLEAQTDTWCNYHSYKSLKICFLSILLILHPTLFIFCVSNNNMSAAETLFTMV